MVLATKYLILALTFILSASQPGISPEQKTQLLAEASKNVALIIPAYIEEQKAVTEGASTTPTFGAITPAPEIAPQDTQIINSVNEQAMAEAQAKQVKIDNAKTRKDAWNATRAKMQANRDALKEIDNQRKILGSGITSGQGEEFNRQIIELDKEYSEVLLPLYQSQAREASQAETEAQ